MKTHRPYVLLNESMCQAATGHVDSAASRWWASWEGDGECPLRVTALEETADGSSVSESVAGVTAFAPRGDDVLLWLDDRVGCWLLNRVCGSRSDLAVQPGGDGLLDEVARDAAAGLAGAIAEAFGSAPDEPLVGSSRALRPTDDAVPHDGHLSISLGVGDASFVSVLTPRLTTAWFAAACRPRDGVTPQPVSPVDLVSERSIDLEAQLAPTRIPARELLALREGDVLCTDHALDQPVQLVLPPVRAAAQGRLCQSSNRRMLEIVPGSAV